MATEPMTGPREAAVRTRARPIRVERRRLLSRMAEDLAAGSDVLVLTAAPGSGKTTVLEQWSEQRRAEGDLVVPISVGSTGATDMRPVIQSAVARAVPDDHVAAVTAMLADVLSGSASAVAEAEERGPDHRPATPVWVMLDDVQQWSGNLAADQIAALLAGARPGLGIAVGTRYTTHAMLSELLLDGRAKEYRIADLAFDRGEAHELMAMAAIDLAEEDLDILLHRTAGWAAGLRLAVLAMTRSADRGAFVRTFAGTDRAVSDYLVSAVLSGLPDGHLEVLLDVSAADRVNLELARLLTGRPDAGAVLDDLVAQNALLGPVAGEPEWYEAHPLLRTYLRAASRRRDEVRFRHRQATAVDWFAAAGQTRRAIQHAAAAADWERVEQLIESSCVHLMMVEGPSSMRELWRDLPAWLQGRQSVAAVAALISSLEGSPDAADLELSVLDAAEGDAARRLALHAISSLAGSRVRTIDRQTVDDALASLDLLSGADVDLAILGRSQATMALAMAGDLAAARAIGSAVLELCRARGLDYTLYRTLIAKAAVCAFDCDFDAVVVHCQEALAVARRHGWEADPRLAAVHGQLAMAAWLRFEDCAAAGHAQRAVAVADAEADPVSAAAAQCQYDIVAVAGRDGLDLQVIGHFQAFNELWSMLPPMLVALNACFELMISLRFHELELAGEIIRRFEDEVPGSPDGAVLRAMRHAYQGHSGLARQELDAALNRENEILTPWVTATAWALVAHVADAADEPARTHDALLNAIRIAEERGLERLVLSATPTMRELLTRHQGRYGRYEGFVSASLARVEQEPPAQGSGVALTEKELMVLRDLPSMLSLREIAEAHVVSVNTIKTHMKSVYRKLGVVSRREAVDGARRLGLL